MSIDGSLQLSQGLDNPWCASVFFMTTISWFVNPHLFLAMGIYGIGLSPLLQRAYCWWQTVPEIFRHKVRFLQSEIVQGKLTIREKGRLRKDIEAEAEEKETTQLTIQGQAVQLCPFMGTTYVLYSLSSHDEPLILMNKVGITYLFCRAVGRTPGRACKTFSTLHTGLC